MTFSHDGLVLRAPSLILAPTLGYLFLEHGLIGLHLGYQSYTHTLWYMKTTYSQKSNIRTTVSWPGQVVWFSDKQTSIYHNSLAPSRTEWTLQTETTADDKSCAQPSF